MSMKKLILALVVVVGSVGYAYMSRTTTAATVPGTDTVAIATQTSGNAIPVQPLAADTSATIAKPVTPAPVATGQYKDGTYTGSVADAYYGNLQVAAVVSGGKLTKVNVLQYPNDRGESVQINQQALPVLIREAIAAQSAHVNGVSGASDTSPAFVQSLGVALASAKA
ncbi:MAG: FMN-binding protein [Parcubacteria group bacterium]|nr:FMN-binding protein [Parcubacteria group bacterium]